MNGADLVTVYRSADQNAADDAQAVSRLLTEAGLHPVISGDETPGVVQGSYEVRVPAAEAATAEQSIASHPDPEDELMEVDPSMEMDLETVAHTDGAIGEMVAIELQSVLRASGIDALIVGASTLPNLGFEVRVPHAHADVARQVIADARASGPAAAEEASQAAEGTVPPPA